jgi:hypothetical protein
VSFTPHNALAFSTRHVHSTSRTSRTKRRISTTLTTMTLPLLGGLWGLKGKPKPGLITPSIAASLALRSLAQFDHATSSGSGIRIRS